jgi:polyferredoxin
MYTKATKAINKTGKILFWVLVIFLIVIQFLNVFGPPPEDIEPVALAGLSQWLFILWASILDKNRKAVHRR